MRARHRQTLARGDRQIRRGANLERFKHEWAKYFRGNLPIKDDIDVSNEDIAGKHLILFGDPASNSLISQVLDGLPLKWTRDSLEFAGVKGRRRSMSRC